LDRRLPGRWSLSGRALMRCGRLVTGYAAWSPLVGISTRLPLSSSPSLRTLVNLLVHLHLLLLFLLLFLLSLSLSHRAHPSNGPAPRRQTPGVPCPHPLQTDMPTARTHHESGGFAEYCLCHASMCLPIPKGFSWQQVAALPLGCAASWFTLFDQGKLKKGEVCIPTP
jgi:hypothetical protein